MAYIHINSMVYFVTIKCMFTFSVLIISSKISSFDSDVKSLNFGIPIIYSIFFLVINFVLIGNLYAAKLKAARAISSGTDAISNKIVPGLTTATQ